MTRSMRALVGVLAVSVAACAHAPAATTATTAPATAATASVPGVNLREPRSGLFTAGQPAATDWQAIRARGIGTVVNLRTDGELNERDEAAEVQAAGMRYISIPVAGAEGIDAENAERLHSVLAAADGPVLVHCASGNRVGGLLALMQARSGAMTPEQALDFGRKAGMVSTEARVRQLLDQQRCLLAAQAGSAPAQHCL